MVFKILYITDSDWLERGPLNTHHLLERLSVKNDFQVYVIDNEILWKKNVNRGFISKELLFKPKSKGWINSNVILMRPKIIRIPIFAYFGLLIIHFQKIYRIVTIKKPDIIISSGLITALLGNIISKKQKIPFVNFTFDKFYELIPNRLFKPLGFALESFMAKNSSNILVTTNKLRDYIKSYKIRGNIQVIPSGVEYNLFKMNFADRMSIRKDLGFNDEDRVLLFMGLFYRFSGLMEILTEMKNDNLKTLKLVLIGKGDLLNFMLRFVQKNKLTNRVYIKSWINFRELPKYISACDISILPAYQISVMNSIVPIKVYEYLSMSKPVLCTFQEGIYLEFGKNNGILYFKSIKSLYKKAKILKNKEIEEIGKLGRNFIEKNCNWNNLTEDFIAYLLKIKNN